MDVQIRFTDLSPEQAVLEARTYEAARVLREAGFPCEVVKYMVFLPTDSPAAIYIKESK